MYQTTQANLRKARQRNPIVSVFLSTNPNRIFSISVPPSKLWSDFIEKIKIQFEIESKLDISRFGVYQMDSSSVDMDRIAIDIVSNDMTTIAHKTELEIVIKSESEAMDSNDDTSDSSIVELNSDENDDENDDADSETKDDNSDSEIDVDSNNNKGLSMDIFGRFNRVVKMKSSKKKGVNRPMHHWPDSDLLTFDPKQIWRDLKRRKLKATHQTSEFITLTDTQTNISLQTRAMVWPQRYRDNDNSFEISLEEINRQWKWAIIICHGGRFAGAIYDGTSMVKHKTFARYTTRKKQGKRQINYMASGGGAKSAGGHKRIHMEKKLLEEIQRLLNDWCDDLQACDAIFVNAPGPYNTMTLFGKAEEQNWLYPQLSDGRLNTQLSKDRLQQITKSNQSRSANAYRLYKKDKRIQKIPITTHKVTLDQLSNIHRYLSQCWLNVPPPAQPPPTNDDNNDSNNSDA